MSNGYKLELLEDGNGGAFFNFWDWLSGSDWLWEIAPDGVVVCTKRAGDEVGAETVDLGDEILALLRWLKARNE